MGEDNLRVVGYGVGQPLCLVQKCMPPALQQIQPPFMHDAVSVHGT